MTNPRIIDLLLKLNEDVLDSLVPPSERDIAVAQLCAKLQERRARRTSSLAFKPPEKKE